MRTLGMAVLAIGIVACSKSPTVEIPLPESTAQRRCRLAVIQPHTHLRALRASRLHYESKRLRVARRLYL